MRYRSTYSSYASRRRRRSSGASNYLGPFLILITIGVILVLIFNLWKIIFGGGDNFDAYMHFVEGSAKIRPWNTEGYSTQSSDLVIRPGDQVITSADARVIVEFFDGTIMRMDGNTELTFQEIDGESDEPELSVVLSEGKLWFNKVYKDTKDTNLTVVLNNVEVQADNSSIFSVDNDFDETVRGIHGDDVVVDVKNPDDGKVVDSETIGVGQEIILTNGVLRRYWQYESPDAITKISDVFERSDWYLWNIEEDESPTRFRKDDDAEGQFVEVEPVSVSETDPGDEDEEDEENSEDDEEDEDTADDSEDEEVEDPEEDDEAEVSGNLSAPSISSVGGSSGLNDDGLYVVSSGSLATLQGSVQGAAKVVVNGYTLQQFTPGSSSWTYYANADYGYMQPGENTYRVHAEDADGNKSEELVVKVLYQVQDSGVVSDPEPESEPEEETQTETESNTDDTPEETPEPEVNNEDHGSLLNGGGQSDPGYESSEERFF